MRGRFWHQLIANVPRNKSQNRTIAVFSTEKSLRTVKVSSFYGPYWPKCAGRWKRIPNICTKLTGRREKPYSLIRRGDGRSPEPWRAKPFRRASALVNTINKTRTLSVCMYVCVCVCVCARSYFSWTATRIHMRFFANVQQFNPMSLLFKKNSIWPPVRAVLAEMCGALEKNHQKSPFFRGFSNNLIC